jgi:molybdopterin-guanine dinucleotide biosynthesis protein A
MEREATHQVSAVVLAGGKADKAFQAAANVENRALAEIGGRPMVQYVLDALADARTIARVVLVGDAQMAGLGPVAERVEPAGDLFANIERGLHASSGCDAALLVTADIPFLTAEAIDAFVTEGLAAGAALCYPAIPRAANEAAFPEMRRTYATVQEGTLTGGNTVLVRPDVLLSQAAIVREAYAMRKKPLQLARRLGPMVIVKFLLRRLRIADAEAAAGRILGAPVRILVTPHAALGADIDKPEDLAAARARLGVPTGRE